MTYLADNPIVATLVEGGYAKGPDESVPHAILRCALERLEALEASRAAGQSMAVSEDPDGEPGEYVALLFAPGNPFPVAALGGIDVAPPHAYYTVVEADLAIEAKMLREAIA